MICPKCRKEKEISDFMFDLIIGGGSSNCSDCHKILPPEIIARFVKFEFAIYVKRKDMYEFILNLESNNLHWENSRRVDISDIPFKSDNCFCYNYKIGSISVNQLGDLRLDFFRAMKVKIYDFESGEFI